MFNCVFDAGSQTVPFKYEDSKRVSYNYDSYFAAKLNGKWGYVNWSTGDIIKEFKKDSYDDLPYPR